MSHAQHPSGARHRYNFAGARIFSIALTLRITVAAWIGADYFLIQDSPGYQGMLDTGTATLTPAAIGADYFLIQDSPGYQGTFDTGTAASNLTWEGRLHTG